MKSRVRGGGTLEAVRPRRRLRRGPLAQASKLAVLEVAIARAQSQRQRSRARSYCKHGSYSQLGKCQNSTRHVVVVVFVVLALVHVLELFLIRESDEGPLVAVLKTTKCRCDLNNLMIYEELT